MKTNHNKATPRVYHTLRRIVQRIPRWLIEKTANAHGVDAWKFSATSHFVMLILGHLSRASCLTEIYDDADLNRRKLSLVRIEAGKPHDSTMADELTKDMKGGDILLADRAYVDFAFLHNLTAREVFWVLRQKANMLYEVVERREESGNIISDEVVRLTAANTAEKYPQTFRRVRAIVEVNGESREMTLSSSPDGTRRSPASLESCVLRCGWIWTSWRLCAYMGWHHPHIDRDRTAFSSIWRAFEPQIPNLVG